MYFIAILITFFLLQQLGSFRAFQKDGWFSGLHETSAKLLHNPWLVYGVSVVLPALLLLVLLALFHDRFYGFVSLLLSIATLIYSLGRADYNRIAEEYRALWQQGDYERMPHALQSMGNASADLGEGLEITHVNFRDAYIHAAFQGLFAVLFWFVLLGPAAAFFYRLNTFFAGRSDWKVAHGLQSALEWPAACLASLTFVFMGDYQKAMPQWLATVFNRGMSNRHIVHANALAAVGLGMDWLTMAFARNQTVTAQAAMALQEMQLLMQLVRRSLVFLVFVVAIFQIVI